MHTLTSKLQKGFTLIELLVATSLLILLSTVVIASFRQANITSRDAKRKADLQLIRGYIESYRLETGGYPGSAIDDGFDEGDEISSIGGAMISSMGLAGFSSGPLSDPLNDAGSGHYYRYILRNQPGCPYELAAVMEKPTNAQDCNASCGSLNPENYYCLSN